MNRLVMGCLMIAFYQIGVVYVNDKVSGEAEHIKVQFPSNAKYYQVRVVH